MDTHDFRESARHSHAPLPAGTIFDTLPAKEAAEEIAGATTPPSTLVWTADSRDIDCTQVQSLGSPKD